MAAWSVAARLLDVMETDVLPMTERGVAAGNKVFGAALLRKSDMSLVLAGTNSETDNPLLHGEVSTLNQFYEIPDRPRTRDLMFLSTHEPCPLCLSAITWAGFDNFYYFFTRCAPSCASRTSGSVTYMPGSRRSIRSPRAATTSRSPDRSSTFGLCHAFCSSP